MAKKRPAAKKKVIEQYAHQDKKRVNNPPVGLVTPETDPMLLKKKTYQYDPHLDPQLVWTGKAERTSFEIPTVSLHVHERIDPKTIIAAVRSNGDRPHSIEAKKASSRKGKAKGGDLPLRMGEGQPARQLALFETREENPPLRDALDFYKHPHGWTNRLIAGDSLLVMNSLLEKEGLAGKVQMIYIDPPYGIRYGSNFQPFVNRRDVKDGKDEDLTQEPETLKAFRDTWELGIHSYLTYLRDRLLLARELLHESGSIFVQIGDENVHLARTLLDECFGPGNFHAQINFKSTSALGQKGLGQAYDYILWYVRDAQTFKYRPLFRKRDISDDREWKFVDDASETNGFRSLSLDAFSALETYHGVFRRAKLTSSGFTETCTYTFQLHGLTCRPFGGKSWLTTQEGMQKMILADRLFVLGSSPYSKQYYHDFPVVKYDNSWSDQPPPSARNYVVETATKFIQRCMLMTTDPGDLVFDPTCGSGTTAFVAEQWGRRWITCDTSRVAVTLAKQRLMTAGFDYFTLAHPQEGIGSGFVYKTVPHITLKSIANNPEIKPGMSRKQIDAAIAKYADQETLYDQPVIDKTKARVTGPFTLEAVPAINVRPIDALEEAPAGDTSVTRSGATSRQDEWRDELARTGVRGKGGAKIEFARLEPLPAARSLHAIGETNEKQPKTVAVSFGPEHAPLEQRQVEQAWEEARGLTPKPAILLFAAFHFDPEAAKDIDELDPQKAGMQFLKLQMNTDLLTDDLKKKRASNESFWLIGQPEVELRQIKKGDDKGLWQVEVQGFDYYNPVNGKIESGDTSKIAMWLLDTDYDGRSLYPRQVFFPMSGEKDGWSRMAKNLKAEIDEELIEAYRGTESLPFAPGAFGRVAVKIVDDRGIESLKILPVEKP